MFSSWFQRRKMQEATDLRDENLAIATDFKGLLRSDRKSDAERGLCSTCARYDWRWLFSRYELIESLGIGDFSGALTEEQCQRLKRITGEATVAIISPSSKTRHPFVGMYNVEAEDAPSEIALRDLNWIMASQSESSFCDLIYRTMKIMDPKVVENSGSQSNINSVTCRIYGSKQQQDLQSVPIHSNFICLVAKVPFGGNAVRLGFTC